MPAVFAALLSLCALAAKPIPTTEPDYRIDSWDTEDGLPENSATAMIQDRAGHLWLGTLGGLVRSQGSKLERFDRSNWPQLPSERIVNLYLDAAGRMWASTTKGLVICDQSGWHVPDGWAGDLVRTFSERANGDLLITTADGLLLEWKDGWLRRLPLPPGHAEHGYFGHADEDGTWCVVGSDFIGHWDGHQWAAAPELGAGATGCCAASKGGMWLFALDERTLLRIQHGREAARLKLPERPGGFWGMSEDREGNVWICTMDRGVCCVSSSGEFRRWDTSNGLAADSTRFVFQDAEQNIWVGTSGGGVNRLKRKRFQTIGVSEGLPERSVHSVYASADGSLLFGTFGGGLVRLRDGKLESIPLPGWKGEKVYIQSVLADRSGRLWVGTFGQGLWLRESGTSRHIAPDQTGGRYVAMLFEDSRGRVWMDGGDGTVVYESGGFRSVQTHAQTRGDPFRFTQDAAGAVWAANRTGVFCYKDGALVELTNAGSKIRGTNVIYGDSRGALWIASEEAGLLCHRAGTITHVDPACGIPAAEVHAIIEDRLGALWMTSSRGLYRVSRDDLLAYSQDKRGPIAVTLFNRDDGLVGVEFSSDTQPLCTRDRDGRLWFATPHGAVVTDPATLRLNSRPPPIEIEAMTYRSGPRTASEIVVAPGESTADQIRLAGPFLRPPQLPAGSRWIEIHYAALSFAAPSKVRFQVKLEPVISDWQDVGNQRMAYYHEPPPGDYTFRVRAANNDGIWNTEGATLAFTVEPYYWQTAWFRAIIGCAVAVLAGAAGWALLRLRHRREMRLQRRRNELAHLSRVAMLGELSGSLTHELNQPLTAILANAQAAQRLLQRGPVERVELAEILSDIVDDDQRASEIIRRLRLLLKKGEITREPLDMNQVITDVLRLLRANLSSHDVSVRTDFEPHLPPVSGDRVQLQQVLLNLLMNAAESAGTSTNGDRSITVRTRRLNGTSVETSVIDHGGGIAADRIDRIFEPFFTTKPWGLGLGLSLCRTIVSAHGGRLSAANNPDGGAAFHVTLTAAGGGNEGDLPRPSSAKVVPGGHPEVDRGPAALPAVHP
jgi:signal transduction histidine kinase/ligand-binding sensor domain-containing protein